MTSELQKAMACYEEARGRYRLAVLASLRGATRGDVIRRAIRECQAAGDDLRRLTALSSRVIPGASRHRGPILVRGAPRAHIDRCCGGEP